MAVPDRDFNRVSAELASPGPDPDALELVLRDTGLSAFVSIRKRMPEAKRAEFPVPECPNCGRRMRRHGSRRTKTFTTRVEAERVEPSYCWCRSCGQGVYPLDAWLKLEGESMTPGASPRAMQVIALPDGVKSIEAPVETVFPAMRATFILDLFHVPEKPHAALAKMISGPAYRRARVTWLKELAGNGGVETVVREPAPRATSFDAVREFVTCCRSNHRRMRYDAYRRRKLRAGSGIIEGCCKRGVTNRIEKSDSRWSVAGASGIMAIRSRLPDKRLGDVFAWRATA